MKAVYTLLIILNLISVKLLAGTQNPRINQLRKQVSAALQRNSPRTDTLTISQLNDLAEEYFETDPDSTAYYATLALNQANDISYLTGMADAYIQIASVNIFKSSYKTARENFLSALHLYRRLHNDYGISEAFIGLARVQDYLGYYDNAITLLKQALVIRKKLGNKIDMASCYAIMGITYDNKGDFSQALDCYFKALTIDLMHKDQLAAADNYCNIGVVMQHLELYPKARDYFDQAYAIWIKLNDKQGISTACQNIGEVLMHQKNYRQAIGYLKKAYSIYHQMSDQEGISLIDYDLGLYHSYTGRPDSAIYYLKLSLKSATNNKIKFNKTQAYMGLAQVYNLMGNYSNAYTCALKAQNMANDLGSMSTRADATLQLSKALAGLKQYEKAYGQRLQYEVLKDSLKSSELIQKTISYNMEVDFGKRLHQQNVQRNQKDALYQQKITTQKRTDMVYVVIILVMAVMVIVYYRSVRRQQKVNMLLAEKNNEVLQQKTDLNLQADKLDELNKLKDRLISVLAHDLREPLSTLRGLFDVLTHKDITHTEFIDMAPRVFSKLGHTSDFLDTLLFWINSQVDDVENNIKSFCLSDVVRQELVYLDEQFKLKNIIPVNKVYPGHIVLADPSSIRIVIHNFLTNAIKFSVDGSIIEVGAHTHNNEVVFTVTDHGTGMTSQQVNSLFKGKVVSTPGTSNEIGTGMGLVFCKDLIEKYKGTIWAKSTPGAGTELGFTLPVGANVDATGTAMP